MSAVDYLSEDGSGTYGRCHVADLVPSKPAAVELVLVFESPHVDELRAGLPVVGAAGKSALRYLLPDQQLRDLSLGRFVQQSHAAGDDRIAILNVSNVPLQAAAFVDLEAPDLDEGDWVVIGRIRRSRARSMSSIRAGGTRPASEVLVDGLRKRLTGVAPGSDGRVVAAGKVAQRFVAAAIPDMTPNPLHVPHPSLNQWHRMANQNLPDLVETRHRFRR